MLRSSCQHPTHNNVCLMQSDKHEVCDLSSHVTQAKLHGSELNQGYYNKRKSTDLPNAASDKTGSLEVGNSMLKCNYVPSKLAVKNWKLCNVHNFHSHKAILWNNSDMSLFLDKWFKRGIFVLELFGNDWSFTLS